MFANLKRLCELNGISGREDEVRAEIIKQIASYCTYHVDALGNVIAFKKGKETPKNKLLLSAHMDEVGMIVTGITTDGMLRIATVGGIDARVILGRAVRVGEKNLSGVIGTKAVHMLTAEERESAITIDNLFVDIGVADREQALLHVQPGDSVTFDSSYTEFGIGRIKAKAIDDRFGCAVLIELIRSDLVYDTYFSFVVQEEVGLRGAKVAAFSVNPDVAIVLEATTASDLTGVDELRQVCKLGDGPVVTFMDRATIYDKELYDLAFAAACENGIPCQTKTMIAGGNDAGAISLAGNGVRTLAISVPCRYLHSPACVICEKDAVNALALVRIMAQKAAMA